jgi:hypothetical protein
MPDIGSISTNEAQGRRAKNGKQEECRDCGRQFVENPQWKPIDPDCKAMIDRGWAIAERCRFWEMKGDLREVCGER